MYNGSILKEDDGPGVTIPAKDLRDKEKLKTIPNDKPGWYRWWAPEEALKQLLDSEFVTKGYFNELKPKMTERDGYYYIYVGITNDSIRNRLNWHVNDLHTEKRVNNGRLSTLRKSIASLVAGNQFNKQATNEFIDKLTIEYFAVQLTKDAIEKNEHAEMDRNLLPLNIRDNNYPESGPFKRDLKMARKKSKK